MQVILSNSAEKFLDKQCNGDPKGIYKIRVFLADLSKEHTHRSIKLQKNARKQRFMAVARE